MRISDWSSDVCSSDLPLQRFQLDAKSAFVASMLLGALEVGRTDPALANSMRQRTAETLVAVTTLANLRTATQVSVGIWSHWFFASTGTHRYEQPDFRTEERRGGEECVSSVTTRLPADR